MVLSKFNSFHSTLIFKKWRGFKSSFVPRCDGGLECEVLFVTLLNIMFLFHFSVSLFVSIAY